MNKARIERSIQRIACEIAENQHANHRPIVLFGIETRGFALARILAKRLAQIRDSSVDVIQLRKDKKEKAFEKLSATNLESPIVFVVDDVIFSGQTMFDALTEVVLELHPAEIHTVVLIDRGHRKFPVKAEFYGMQLPTKLNEHVNVGVNKMQINEVRLNKF